MPQKTGGFDMGPQVALQIPKPAPIKGRPAYFLHDKEQLYDEAFKLKQNMNHCKEDNLRLKSKIQQLDREMDKRDKIIQDLLLKVDSEPAFNQSKMQRPQADSHLVVALKKQVKSIKDEIRQKEEESIKLKKNLKITRMQEMDIEKKMFTDECTRLKHIIEEIMKQKAIGYTAQDIKALGDRMNQQANLLNNIKNENNEISAIIQKKDEELNNWKEVVSKLEKKIVKLEGETKENLKTRKNLNESKKEVQKLKEQLAHIKVESKDKQTASYKTRIDELLRKQRDLSDKLENKEKKIKVLESKLSEASPQKKQNDLENELTQLRKKAKDCISSFYYKGIVEKEIGAIPKELLNAEDKKPASVPSVPRDELTNEMRELRLNLIIAKIPMEDLSKLFVNYETNDMITIYELARSFKRDPLLLALETKKIARYLIEQKGMRDIQYNEMTEERIAVVLDHLASFVGNYNLYPEAEEKSVQNSICDVIIDNNI
jgi:myosin heavy subunit